MISTCPEAQNIVSLVVLSVQLDEFSYIVIGPRVLHQGDPYTVSVCQVFLQQSHCHLGAQGPAPWEPAERTIHINAAVTSLMWALFLSLLCLPVWLTAQPSSSIL